VKGELNVAFRIPFVFDFMRKTTQAAVRSDEKCENRNVRNSGQGRDQHRRDKRGTAGSSPDK
jgi:hypothetical protein